MKQSRALLILLTAAVLLAAGCANNQQEPEPILQTVGPEQWLEIARNSKKNGDYQYAKSHYQQILIEDSDNIEALSGLALSYNKLKQHKMALTTWERVLQLEPKNPKASLAAAVLCIRYGRLDLAESYLDNAKEADKRDWQVHNMLGVIEDLRGNYAHATGHYFQALMFAPGVEKSGIYNNIGYSQIMAKLYDRAIDSLLHGLQFDPYSERLKNNLAIAYAWAGVYNKSYDILKGILDIEEASNNVGYIAMLNNDFDTAEEYFEQAMEQSPNYYKKAFVNMAKLEARRSMRASEGEQSER